MAIRSSGPAVSYMLVVAAVWAAALYGALVKPAPQRGAPTAKAEVQDCLR